MRGRIFYLGVAYMSKINLTKAWNKSVLPDEGPEISPPNRQCLCH